MPAPAFNPHRPWFNGCEFACQICKEAKFYSASGLYHHTGEKHGVSISTYLTMFKKAMTKKTKHTCHVCHKQINKSYEEIYAHIRVKHPEIPDLGKYEELYLINHSAGYSSQSDVEIGPQVRTPGEMETPSFGRALVERMAQEFQVRTPGLNEDYSSQGEETEDNNNDIESIPPSPRPPPEVLEVETTSDEDKDIRKEFRCMHCGECFVSAKQRERHKLEDEKCEFCNIELACKSVVASHRRNCREKINTIQVDDLKCDLCNSTFTSERKIEKHYKLGHNMEWKPGVKSQSNRALQELRNEGYKRKAARDESRYLCNVCDKSYEQESSLISHWRKEHAIPVQNNNGGKRKEYLYPCEPCGQNFNSFEIMAFHWKTAGHGIIGRDIDEGETLERPKKQKPNSPTPVVRQRKEISSPPPVVYERNERKQISSPPPVVHERKRISSSQVVNDRERAEALKKKKAPISRKTKEKRFSCDRCLESFNLQSDLAVHRLTAHEQRLPFNCPKCKKGFQLKEELVMHRNICNKVARPRTSNFYEYERKRGIFH